MSISTVLQNKETYRTHQQRSAWKRNLLRRYWSSWCCTQGTAPKQPRKGKITADYTFLLHLEYLCIILKLWSFYISHLGWIYIRPTCVWGWHRNEIHILLILLFPLHLPIGEGITQWQCVRGETANTLPLAASLTPHIFSQTAAVTYFSSRAVVHYDVPPSLTYGAECPRTRAVVPFCLTINGTGLILHSRAAWPVVPRCQVDNLVKFSLYYRFPLFAGL